MGVIQLPDELQRLIEQQVVEGRASSPAALLEEAVKRMIEDSRAEQDDISFVAKQGVADMEAGRFTLVATEDDRIRLRGRLTSRAGIAG